MIPLRIIDLNAKLYQPFQSLTLPTGSLGANTLLVQYSGVLSFVTPVITLLQAKHPVPFVTTLMVGCGSLMVPFATEAIGLKLHGDCYLNTASKNCGPALGVNRTAGYVLVGLMVVVVVLLGVVMWFTNWGRKGVTGVRANPWNLAGMGSLLGGVRSDLGRGHGKKMRYKRYGMGWYRNQDGREDYGMIVLDEAGQGLQQQQYPTSESESDDMDGSDAVADLKTGVSGSHLPFMTLRIPWRVGLILFQLAVFIFIIYYHAYYRGGIKDNGKLWTFMNANTFGVRFLSAIIGVIVAFCWQSFFLSKSPFLISIQKRIVFTNNQIKRREHHDPLPTNGSLNPTGLALHPLLAEHEPLFGALLRHQKQTHVPARGLNSCDHVRVLAGAALQRPLQPLPNLRRGDRLRGSFMSLLGSDARRARLVVLDPIPPDAR